MSRLPLSHSLTRIALGSIALAVLAGPTRADTATGSAQPAAAQRTPRDAKLAAEYAKRNGFKMRFTKELLTDPDTGRTRTIKRFFVPVTNKSLSDFVRTFTGKSYVEGQPRLIIQGREDRYHEHRYDYYTRAIVARNEVVCSDYDLQHHVTAPQGRSVLKQIVSDDPARYLVLNLGAEAVADYVGTWRRFHTGGSYTREGRAYAEHVQTGNWPEDVQLRPHRENPVPASPADCMWWSVCSLDRQSKTINEHAGVRSTSVPEQQMAVLTTAGKNEVVEVIGVKAGRGRFAKMSKAELIGPQPEWGAAKAIR